MGASKPRRIEPTHDWQLLLPLFEWPEQERYEQIRPLVLFDASVAERAAEVGTSASTLYRRLDRFAEEGMESLFDAPKAKRRRLPPAVGRLIVDLKAEYPAFNLNEIANVVRAAFGTKPDVRSVERVLSEEPVPLKIVRNYPPYHESEDPRQGRAAIVALRLDGWSVKAIAGYLEVHPRGPPFDRLPGFGEVERGRARGPGGRIPRAPTRCEEDGLRRRGGDPQAGEEPRPRGLQGPRRPRAEGLRPLPRHLRKDPRPGPRGLRLREA
jgi:transposase